MNTQEFFAQVITTPRGKFCLGYKVQFGPEWYNEWFEWPTDTEKILTRITELSKDYNVYFSPYLFKETNRIKENVIESRTLAADLDEAPIVNIPVIPTVLVRTSPGRTQAYWIFRNSTDVESHETLSRKMTYSIAGSDHSGWSLGHMFRVPGTLNYKYVDDPKNIIIEYFSSKFYETNDIELLPDHSKVAAEKDDEWINSDIKPLEIHPLELLESIKNRAGFPVKVYAQYNIEAKDRSAALWGLLCAGFRVGLNKEQVFHLGWHSANNKFARLKYHGKRELAKDVLRAEQVVNTKVGNARSHVSEVRKLSGQSFEKKIYIANIIKSDLERDGEFFHAHDDSLWYIRRDSGRPINLAMRSDYLASLLDLQFGLNSTEIEQSYVCSSLISFVRGLPVSGHTTTLSHYDLDTKTVLLHTGRKDVISITKDSISTVINGSYGVIFPWNTHNEPFILNFSPLEKNWWEYLFDPSLNNLIELTKQQASVILRVWLLFLIVRSMAASRPILALFGQPGCLSVETKLSIRRGEHSAREFSIEKLYNNQHGNWDNAIKNRILSVKNNTIQWRNIRRIIKSGKKVTFTVAVEGHEPFRTTADHRFLTPLGYRPLSQLIVGDDVIIKDKHSQPRGCDLSTREIVAARYHPQAQKKNSIIPSIYYYKAVYEANLNNISVLEYLRIMDTDSIKAKTMIVLAQGTVIHHKDENHSNNSLDNLEILTKIEHGTHHGIKNIKNLYKYSGIWQTSVETIQSIEYYGEEETYDIEMEDEEAPNFLVNDVVVHNSGKSTLFKKLYHLLYGKQRSISSVTSPEDFDHSVANDPFVVLDNVDTWERWLPDRLALSAGTSDITKRKLYSDVDTVIMKRQALVGINAHNPKFGREDVADRLLLITFERFKHFTPEGPILQEIIDKRNQLWGAIVLDIQKILNEPIPNYELVPQFRVEDFAEVGTRIAYALGVGTEFYEAINVIGRKQRNFTLEEDSILVNALQVFMKKREAEDREKWYTPNNLWFELERCSDARVFDKLYVNATRLANKLWSMQEALKENFVMTRKIDPDRGTRVWQIIDKFIN